MEWKAKGGKPCQIRTAGTIKTANCGISAPHFLKKVENVGKSPVRYVGGRCKVPQRTNIATALRSVNSWKASSPAKYDVDHDSYPLISFL